MSMAETADQLIAEQLKSELHDVLIGREIIVLQQTGSTNDAILQTISTRGAAVSSSPAITEGLVVFAEHQTAGRGQRGNRWESTAGKGLWFSILLRPKIHLSDSGRLTIWATEAIADIIRKEFGLELAIKLPNDVQLYGRKVAGVLVEMRAQAKATHAAVVGIGININQSREDFPVKLQDEAISVAMAVGRQVDRQKFARALLRNLDVTYRERFSAAVTAANASVPTTIHDKRAAKFRTA
jgi:BirA family transcriptional regulator, biotin operon repressor / biotin---[acetyl-CoA-carboxylase] ligase